MVVEWYRKQLIPLARKRMVTRHYLSCFGVRWCRLLKRNRWGRMVMTSWLSAKEVAYLALSLRWNFWLQGSAQAGPHSWHTGRVRVRAQGFGLELGFGFRVHFSSESGSGSQVQHSVKVGFGVGFGGSG
jgi:hypothetical protein